MPIYDFCCKKCGYITELMRKMSESSVTTCPKCKQESLEKMLSAPSFQLNGTGWYATDFKTKNDKKSSNDKTSASEKTNTSSEASTSSTETTAAACAPGCACH